MTLTSQFVTYFYKYCHPFRANLASMVDLIWSRFRNRTGKMFYTGLLASD